jgi:hypothetical protein
VSGPTHLQVATAHSSGLRLRSRITSRKRRSKFVLERHPASREIHARPQIRLWRHAALTVVAGTALALLLWGLLSSTFSQPFSNELRIELIRLVMYILAGAAGVVALVIAYRRQRIGEAAEQREALKLYNERFSSASDQLSSERAANRLAGAYAMAALADDWAYNRQMCINVLCAYLRMPYDPPVELADDTTDEIRKDHFSRREEQQVRWTILDIIGERLRSDPTHAAAWQGCTFDLGGAVIDGGTFEQIRVLPGTVLSFLGAEFSGSPSFMNAIFAGGVVSFRGAVFDNIWASFKCTKFEAGEIDFWATVFQSGHINFYGAIFQGGNIDLRDTRFHAGRVAFDGAQFVGSDVDFRKANFNGCQIDFREVASWSVPPRFDAFSDGPPEGLHLPTG